MSSEISEASESPTKNNSDGNTLLDRLQSRDLRSRSVGGVIMPNENFLKVTVGLQSLNT
jgi:hypothetical protein